MTYWLASAAGQVRTDWLKRFDARYWTVDFARPMMASAVTTGPAALRVDAVFYRQNDLAGIIWASEDKWDHPLVAYETKRDYRGTTLGFRWRSSGDVRDLAALDGPTLTIEGRDAAGAAKSWYVRLWNYAEGTPTDAAISLDFDAMDGGFLLPGEADPVWAGDIDRMFISLVPGNFTRADLPLESPVEAAVWIEDIRSDGPGSVLTIGDACVPPHRLRMAGGYDDSYNLTPERVLTNALRLGYREWFNHYVGMSHYFRLGWDGARFVVQAGDPLNLPCRSWHADFLARAAALGLKVILSLSYELFDAHAPEAWKQRAGDGSPALTGWVPPSTLLSPANGEAMSWLQTVGTAFAAMGPAMFQIGEPWWWTGFGADQRPCFYDEAARAAYFAETGAAAPAPLASIAETPSAAQAAFHAWLGGKLAASTLALRDAMRAAGAAKVALLFYAPQVLQTSTPWLRTVNMPAAWAWPAFDVLQLEDYDFVAAGDTGASRRARTAVQLELGYALSEQHYFSGFVLNGSDIGLWKPIAAAAEAALSRGVAETFVWALPQVMRDGFTFFEMTEDEGVQGFHDVRFPLELGEGASGGPMFSTQVVTSVSGHEQRNIDWAAARLGFDAGPGVRSEADLGTLIAFFRARQGRAFGFRFRDPFDWSSNGMTGAPGPGDQAIGSGDGVQTTFALTKRYGEGELRRITRPEPGSVRVAVGGIERTSGWTLGALGEIEFDIAPAAAQTVTAGFRFDVPVRFAEDSIEASLQGWRAGEMPSAPIIEVRDV